MFENADFQTEMVLLPHEQSVLVVCESAEPSFLGQSKQTYNFSLPPSASVEEVRRLLAEKLSTAPTSVHLQALVQDSNEFESVTRGTVADLLSSSNPSTSTLIVTYSTESRFGCFYVCCAALCAGCCCLGYQAGKSDQRGK